MKIIGAKPGGYHPTMAFASGINVQGTKGVTIKGVTVTKAFGDGLTLSPLRGGGDHNSRDDRESPTLKRRHRRRDHHRVRDAKR